MRHHRFPTRYANRPAGFGDTDAVFTGLLKSDGIPDNLAKRSYSETFQSYYKLFRQYGIGPAFAWDMMETIDRDAGATKSLQAGVPPDLVVQAWQYQLFVRNSPTSNAIVNGGNPLQAITLGLQSVGVVPQPNSGIAKAAVSAYESHLPDGVNPGAPYTITDPTTGKPTTYNPDWYNPVAPPTPQQTAALQSQVTDPTYWAFPSGDSGSAQPPAGSMVPAGTPGAGTSISAPIDLPANLAANPWMLAAGAMGIWMLAKSSKGARR